MRCLTLLLCLLSFVSQANESFLLSGRVKASENQTFYAPKTDNWRVQVQWMMPEGEVAKEGDLVVVFDGGSIQSQIEQQQTRLIAGKEELHRIRSQNEQKQLEAVYAQKKTALLLERSRIDANISLEHLSKYDYKKNQLALEEALVANIKALEALKHIKTANSVALNKQLLTIKQNQATLKYYQHKLKQMSVYAKRSGPVLYGNHPWTGEKVFVGMTAQPSWNIAEIPSMNGLYIEAWVHEVDYKSLSVNREVALMFDAYPQLQLTAKLTQLSTQPEEKIEWGQGTYYRSKFEFEPLPELTLLPGMSAQLEFNGGNHE